MPIANKTKTLYLRLLKHTQAYWRVFLLSLFATAILGATEVGIPIILGPMLDGSFVDNDQDAALFYSLMLVGLFAIKGIAQYTSRVAISWVGFKVVMDLRHAMYHKLIHVPAEFYDHNSSGTLLSKFTYDATQVTEATTSALIILVRDSVTVIGLLAFMLYTDWALTLIFFLMTPVISLIVKVISKRLRKINLAIQSNLGEMNALTDEAINGHQEIKLFGGQAYEQKRFNTTLNWVRRYFMKAIVTSSASVPIVQIIAIAMLALIVNIAAAENPPMTVGAFVAFFSAMGLMMSPIKRLTNVMEPLQRGLAAAESVFALMDEASEIDNGTKQLGKASGHIEFKNVAFSYPASKSNTLQHINLDIKPGETIALVGQSGSGKSTLAKLMPRFYLPQEGQIYLDGIDINDIKLSDLRANISFVSQHVVLFNDTLAANIAYGMPDADETAIRNAAENAHAMEFINELPQGLQTNCGQDGAQLSGGQRQRIAIARAILKDAPILILDEATSALDTQSERHVQHALETLQKGRTTIVIAHRLSTIENADRIAVMDKGEIIELGKHKELLADNGVYAKLHNIQFKS